MFVGGEVDVLCEVSAVEYVQKVQCTFTVRGVDVEVEVSKEKNGS